MTTALAIWKPPETTSDKIVEKPNQKLDKKKESTDGRSIGMVARDVHLTNLGEIKRSFEDQIQDRQFLQDCLACWDLLDINNNERSQIENILMEKFWLI